MLLHELSHGFHHQFLEDGFDNPEVKAVYEHAMKAALYDRVLRYSGEEAKAYAATNPKEYFAEISEAYFGTNDFFPFVRAELRRHDPMAFEMLETLWGAKPAGSRKSTPGRKRPGGRATTKPSGAGKAQR
jgi:Mlc titration factor MtfA (ptsG expression regulator)